VADHEQAAGERILGDVRPPGSAAGPTEHDGLVTVWPHLLFRELLVVLLALVLLTAASIRFDAPLEEPADPGLTPNPAKAPWYFVGLQELLVYFDPWVAGVAIPLVIVFGLCAVPYLDPGRAGQGVYTLRRRPVATTIFLVGLAGWFVLIAVGLWFRGPGWAWQWPGAGGAFDAPVAPTRSLPNAVGVPLVVAYFAGGAAWIVRRTAAWPGFTPARRWVFAVLLLAMTGTVLKIVLRLAFGLRYLVSFESSGFNL
jgi:hypothetical protein